MLGLQQNMEFPKCVWQACEELRRYEEALRWYCEAAALASDVCPLCILRIALAHTRLIRQESLCVILALFAVGDLDG